MRYKSFRSGCCPLIVCYVLSYKPDYLPVKTDTYASSWMIRQTGYGFNDSPHPFLASSLYPGKMKFTYIDRHNSETFLIKLPFTFVLMMKKWFIKQINRGKPL